MTAASKPSEDLLFSSDGAGTHPASSGSGMSDERNADSVLFKLDNLKDIQRAEQQQRAASAPLSRLAAPAPASGGSGLIDIKSLAGVPDAREPDAAPAAPPVVASDGSGLIDVAKLADSDSEGEAEARSATATSSNNALISTGTLGMTPTPQPLPTKAPSRTPMIVLSVLALLALGAAIAAILIRGL